MKQRLDVLLVEKGFFPSREKARTAIMEGLVFIGTLRYDKPGAQVDTEAELIVKGSSCPFVSRGGLKLAKAVELWNIDLESAVCMDIGSSTGGFTDCMLQNGASKVYALDVGTNQLDYKLRTDPRVVVMEKTNIRDIDPETFEKMDLVTADVSFIGLKFIFPPASKLLKEGGRMVSLVKPQFEAGRDKVGKGGIVRDKAVHEDVLKNTLKLAENAGLRPLELSFSPITGTKGNIEYLLYLEKTDNMEDITVTDQVITNIVNSSHKELEK